MNIKTLGYFLTILVGFLCLLGSSHGIAVMSVDIGSEWFKVAIVSPGVPMEIALNKESKRKTPTTIAFRDDERFFGEDADTIGVRFPKNRFSYFIDLLEKSIDNPIVKLYKERFPHHDIIKHPSRDTIAFKLDEKTFYTPEELVAQILQKAKEIAESSAGQQIKEAVITVPGYFNQAERKSVLRAAEIAGIRVLQLINDYTAVALNYGIFHRNEFNDTAQYIMFYDMGASTTTATVVSYQNVKTKEKGYVETHPQVSILGVGYDRTLGGLQVQVALQKYLATEFDKLKKTKNSVFDSPRAMAKLFKEAGRVKNVLSANNDHYAQIEGLLDEQDFKFQVTREKLEELAGDMLTRVTNPVSTALDTSALTMDLISHVIIVGAGTRMPKIQEILTKYVQSELSKNVNADEAAVLGAVYKAADLSLGFKVKKFITKDAVLFPIQIVFEKSVEEKSKQVKRILFNKMNAYPQKKIITFNKRKENFEFIVTYADLDYLPAHEVKAIGTLELSSLKLNTVAEAWEKHIKEGAESKGIKAHFALDDSGILRLINIELVSEKSAAAVDKDEGTFSKLGSTISKLFSGSQDTETVEKTEDQPKEETKPVTEEPEGQQKPAEEKTESANQTKPEEQKTENQTVKTEKKLTIVTVKEPISFTETILGPQMLTEEQLEASKEKIKALELRDLEKTQRETALNTLESFVINTRQDLQSEEYKSASTSEEVQKIIEACEKTSEWLDEDGYGASADVYDEKLKELKILTDELYERVYEHKERPEVMSGMVSLLNASSTFLNNMKQANTADQVFTAVEIDTLEKMINDTHDYHEIVIKTTKETKLYEPIKYKVRDIATKMALLDREVKYLWNKLKIWKPKVEPGKIVEGMKENKTESSSNNSTNEKEESTDDTKEEVKVTVDDADSEKIIPVEEEKKVSNDEEKTQPINDKEENHQEL